MRLIDADALIEKCGDWYVEEGTESGFIGTLESLLVTQPTITHEPHWIPVTERLPETTGEYLVTKREMYTHRLIVDIAVYFVNDGWHKADPVIAWMPLPEAWRR